MLIETLCAAKLQAQTQETTSNTSEEKCPYRKIQFHHIPLFKAARSSPECLNSSCNKGPIGSFHKIGGPQYRPQYIIVLIIGTPKMVPLILGNPQFQKAASQQEIEEAFTTFGAKLVQAIGTLFGGGLVAKW